MSKTNKGKGLASGHETQHLYILGQKYLNYFVRIWASELKANETLETKENGQEQLKQMEPTDKSRLSQHKSANQFAYRGSVKWFVNNMFEIILIFTA